MNPRRRILNMGDQVDSSEKRGPIVGCHITQLRDAALRHRQMAEQCGKLARLCWAVPDRIVYEEFERRALEDAKRFDSCADEWSRRAV